MNDRKGKIVVMCCRGDIGGRVKGRLRTYFWMMAEEERKKEKEGGSEGYLYIGLANHMVHDLRKVGRKEMRS